MPPGCSPSRRADGRRATHAAIVEVDPETGVVTIDRFLVVHECGDMINPAVVDGQIRGGVAQGIGQALYEQVVYDEDGSFVTATFMDYLVPTACEIPAIEIDHLEAVDMAEVNFRGVGEGGAIAAPPAVLNAVADAVAHLGVEVTRLPITPHHLLAGIRSEA